MWDIVVVVVAAAAAAAVVVDAALALVIVVISAADVIELVWVFAVVWFVDYDVVTLAVVDVVITVTVCVEYCQGLCCCTITTTSPTVNNASKTQTGHIIIMFIMMNNYNNYNNNNNNNTQVVMHTHIRTTNHEPRTHKHTHTHIHDSYTCRSGRRGGLACQSTGAQPLEALECKRRATSNEQQNTRART